MVQRALGVVVCAHNRVELLNQALTVLDHQSVKDYAVVVIDDSDPDEIGNYADHPCVLLHHWSRCDGAYHRVSKYNLGAAIAPAAHIVLLDDDCLPLGAEFVAGYLDALRDAPIARGLFQDSDLAQLPPWFSTANIGFQRKWYLEMGGLDPAYDGHYGYEDADLGKFVEAIHAPVAVGDARTAVRHRGTPYSGTRDQVNERYYRAKWGFPPI